MSPGASEARRAALWAGGLDLVTGGLALLALRSTRLPSWPLWQFAALGALSLGLLLVWRPPRWAALAVLAANFASGLLMAAVTANAEARLSVDGGLFNSTKVSMFVIALLSPSWPLGVAAIAGFAALPVVLSATWPAVVTAHLPAGEPWLTPVFGAAAVGLLVYRLRTSRLVRALAQERANRRAAQRLAEVSMAVRDLANTPLQTLTTGLDLLSRSAPDGTVPIDSMRRALDKLQGLRASLAKLESEPAPAREGFDAGAQIERVAGPPRR